MSKKLSIIPKSKNLPSPRDLFLVESMKQMLVGLK